MNVLLSGVFVETREGETVKASRNRQNHPESKIGLLGLSGPGGAVGRATRFPVRIKSSASYHSVKAVRPNRIGALVQRGGQQATSDPKSQVKAGKKFAAMIAEGFDFPDGAPKLNAYYFASRYAKESGNAELMGKCFNVFKGAENINPRFLEQLEKEYKAMKETAGKKKTADAGK